MVRAVLALEVLAAAVVDVAVVAASEAVALAVDVPVAASAVLDDSEKLMKLRIKS